MRYRFLVYVLSVFFIFVLLAGNVSAQTGAPHAIYGYVNYNSSPFFGANVTAQNTRTGETISSDNTTGSDGNYIVQLVNLPSGFEGGDEVLVTSSSNEYSGNKTVIVNASVGSQQVDNITLAAEKPTSNHPSDATYDKNAAGKTIGWILTDNYSPGYYKVLKNSQTYVSWKTWTNNSNLNVPIATGSTGQFNYTICFNDSVGEDGVTDKVIITIRDSSSSQSGGGGGGGGGFSPASEIKTDSQGKLISNHTKESSDGNARIIIHAGTIALDVDGKPLESVSITKADLGGTIAAYNIGPDGATFSPQAELEIKFDSSEAKNKDLIIRMFKGGKWTVLETTVDTRADTITAKVPHFTIFALFSKEKQPVPTKTPEITPPKETQKTETPSLDKEKSRLPGFEVTFAILGLLAVAYLIRPR